MKSKGYQSELEVEAYLVSSVTSSMKPDSHLGHTKSFKHHNSETLLTQSLGFLCAASRVEESNSF